MTTPTYREHGEVRSIETAASDGGVIQAMLVSTDPEASLALEAEASTAGRINYLMRNRHGSPFEHNMFKFYVEAPIFIFREWHRHRIGWSYNEQSGRYGELPPVFWVPDQERNLVQVGKPGNYSFVPGTPEQYANTKHVFLHIYEEAYEGYRYLIEAGIANEVARAVLPVGLYSRMYATCNARSLMSFLSLRTLDDGVFPSKPMQEIHEVAKMMELQFAWAMPLTYAAFNDNGRVAP